MFSSLMISSRYPFYISFAHIKSPVYDNLLKSQ
jgi:hypothetical protein